MSASSSDAPSPQAAAAKSSRVCLNCRRKKKRCDKVLPACGRCTYSLEVCQHDEDLDYSENPGAASSFGFSPVMASPNLRPMPYLSGSVPEYLPGQQPGSVWGTLNPSLFTPMDRGEDIHTFTFRCLSDFLNRPHAEQIMSYYFSSINTWFTIIESFSFRQQLADSWLNPKAEVGVLVLCMRLIIRTPTEHLVPNMSDSLYLSAKVWLSLVQNRLPLSIPLLQATLLVALYEVSHSMPQQAFLTVGSCCQMIKALGWLQESFWAERQNTPPSVLKVCSILWWATVYIDNLVHVTYEETNFPLNTAGLASHFSIPFPETFDRYLPGRSGGFEPLDAHTERIEGMVWPESTSAFYLHNVLQQTSRPAPLSLAERNDISDALTTHTSDIMNSNWNHRRRCAVVGSNFIALLRLNRSQLLVDTDVLASLTQDQIRPIATVSSVIGSIYEGFLHLSARTAEIPNGNTAPVGAVAVYYAARLLIDHGEGALQDTQWLTKVESLKRVLEVLNKRWTIAGRYVGLLNTALNRRLGVYLGADVTT